jgi:hypothetical protein
VAPATLLDAPEPPLWAVVDVLVPPTESTWVGPLSAPEHATKSREGPRRSRGQRAEWGAPICCGLLEWVAFHAQKTVPCYQYCSMPTDEATGEVFGRIVGRRQRPSLGEMPSAEARQAYASLQRYVTCAPKGVFRYRDHESMEADRLRWTVARMMEPSRGG